MRVVAFHGTDYDVAQKIKEGGFIVKPNPEHWLGNAIYFYTDETLAKWWTTRPTCKFGTTIYKPALIKVYISADDSRVLDLRKLEDYSKFLKWENEYKERIIKEYEGNTKPRIDSKQYRCELFDTIFNDKGIDLIVGCFHKLDQPYYVLDEVYDVLDRLSLVYTEVQVAVKAERQSEIIKILDINNQLSV